MVKVLEAVRVADQKVGISKLSRLLQEPKGITWNADIK
jgi:hypothetical protein